MQFSYGELIWDGKIPLKAAPPRNNVPMKLCVRAIMLCFLPLGAQQIIKFKKKPPELYFPNTREIETLS